MMKNLNEYKMKNPFKAPKFNPDFLDHMTSQLKTLEFLSASTISMLSIGVED